MKVFDMENDEDDEDGVVPSASDIKKRDSKTQGKEKSTSKKFKTSAEIEGSKVNRLVRSS